MIEQAIRRRGSSNKRHNKSRRRDSSRPSPANEWTPPKPQLFSADTDVGDIFDVILRHKWLIIAIVIVSVIAASVYLSVVQPRYTASAQVIIDSRQPQVPTFDSVIPGLANDNQSVQSEAQVLQSRILASSVIEKLNLQQDPEFNSALREPGWMDRLTGMFAADSAPETEERRSARLVNSFLSHLTVTPIPNSRVISVSVTSADPAGAAAVANALVDEYVLAQQEARFLATTEVTDFLSARIDELQQQLLVSEREIEAYRSDANLLQTRGSTMTAQQLSDLNAQLVVARTATAEAEARLEQLTVLLESPESGGIHTASEVLQSPLIRDLRAQQVGVNRRIAELSSEFGMAHPTMVQLRAEAADLDGQIELEVNKIAQGLRNEVAVAQARERTLQQQLEQLRSVMSQTNTDEIHLRALEREADVNRQLLATLLGRQKSVESRDQLEFQQADSRVISYADSPSSPSFPQKGFTLGIATLLSLLLGLIVVFVRELRQRGFLNVDQLEAETGVPAVGFVPRSGFREYRGKILDSLVTTPRAPFSQAISTVNWQLGNLAPQQSHVFLVTSSTSAEGKTVSASAIARTKAMGGAKTLLIDGDCRKPGVHKGFDKTQSPGLTDVLLGEHNAKDVIVYDSKSSLDILVAGKACLDPLSLLDSQQMDALLRELKERYEYIVIDSPPVLAAPDACALSKKVDTTLFAVRWSTTPREVVNHALRQLARAGGHVTGTLLTMLVSNKHSRYAYGYYSYYATSAADEPVPARAEASAQ